MKVSGESRKIIRRKSKSKT